MNTDWMPEEARISKTKSVLIRVFPRRHFPCLSAAPQSGGARTRRRHATKRRGCHRAVWIVQVHPVPDIEGFQS